MKKIATGIHKGSAYYRAAQLLRNSHPLTDSELHELDNRFEAVSAVQYLALRSDPAHSTKLSAYDSWVRANPFPTIFFLASMLTLSVFVGLVLGAAN